MHIVGITGPSGSGKSLLGNYLISQNIPVIDADEVYHSLLVPPSECLDKLRDAFGDDIFAEDGSLDRTKLATLVFNDKTKLDLLNATVLDVVLKKIRLITSEYEKNGYFIHGRSLFWESWNRRLRRNFNLRRFKKRV